MKKGGLATYKERNLRIYINEHLFTLIRMEPLYEIAGLSKSHFHRAFCATFGERPTNYINRKRVEAACHRLEEGDEPLAEIALGCGWADQPHFTKRFFKVTGYTPKQWRMEHGYLGK